MSYEGIASAVLQHVMADLPGHLSPAFISFMSAALTYDPTQRPSAMQLLEHPWIQVCESSTFYNPVQMLDHNLETFFSETGYFEQSHVASQCISSVVDVPVIKLGLGD